jgi:hypothetical protein
MQIVDQLLTKSLAGSLFLCRVGIASLLRELKGISIHLQNDYRVSAQRAEGHLYSVPER